MSTKSQDRDTIVTTYSHVRPTIPDLLNLRQVFGIGVYWNNHQNIAVTELANRIAWNPNRMQNMILSVGPKTPASLCMSNHRLSSNSSSENHSDEERGAEVDDEEGDVDTDQGEERAATENQESHAIQEEIFDREDDEDDHENESDKDHSQNSMDGNSIEDSSGENQHNFDDWEWRDSDYGSSDGEDDDIVMQRKIGHYVASMRHGGCINTAAWLTCPWRLSLCGTNRDGENASPIISDECSTQIITSGDDRLIKFWDVSYAMGSSSPLPGGIDTFCPFSSELPVGQPAETWKSIQKSKVTPISGSVLPLATLRTGHFGNIFHVTPLDHEPGKIVTCGADGLLQCSDLVSGTSSIIMHSEHRAEDEGAVDFLFRRPKMCFSHHFIDAHYGLLCSQRGLLRFDIRIRSRDQPARPILSDETCKACALWSKNSDTSAYVFVGGSSADVILYDLRMVSDSDLPSKVVQTYRPRGLSANAEVSVSGICVSKNSKELLVSYENDQIYTFPICPSTKYSSGPTVDELSNLSIEMETKEIIQRELCAYGGHLNRYTFLKNAKYAGPSDQFICTGSDSGHAWIFDKTNGTVASLLKTDNSTCNGVIPHPTLPLFITYGIDSTAKLWRATVPVDRDVDDSPLGRSNFFKRVKKYKRSSLVNNWSDCEKKLSRLLRDDESADICVMPDHIPSASRSHSFFSAPHSHHPQEFYIANDLQNLPNILRRNFYSCLEALGDHDEDPIRSDIEDFKRRMSLICLKHQADERGLSLDLNFPWKLKKKSKFLHSLKTSVIYSDSEPRPTIPYNDDPADMIPSSPSDWLPYDPEMTPGCKNCALDWNLEDYEEFYRRYYTNLLCCLKNRMQTCYGLPSYPVISPRNKRKLENHDVEDAAKVIVFESSSNESQTAANEIDLCEKLQDCDVRPCLTNQVSASLNSIQRVVEILKASGNDAFNAGLLDLAASRYDQALRYCSVVFMKYPRGNIDILVSRWETDPKLEWSTMLKLLITLRLNLCMVLLKFPTPEPAKAIELAKLAVMELCPFSVEKGQVRHGKNFQEVIKTDEPESTYFAAEELQAKAFFRMGSAFHALGDYAEAINNFELSIACAKSSNIKPEIAVLRRLDESKRLQRRQMTKLRNKFKQAFGCDIDE